MPHYNPTKRKRRRRDTQCCGSISLIKCLLHIFNILFMISGVAILTLACWTIFWKLEYASLLVSIAYEVGTYGLAVAGALAVIGGFLACFGIFFEHRAIVLFYTFLLAVVFSLELIIGGFGYYYESQIEDELKRTLNSTFLTSYGFHERRTVAIDGMQQAYKCCGAIRFEDWRSSDWLHSNETDLLRAKDGHVVPDSCCITVRENCGRRDHPSNIPYTGCIYQFTDNLRRDITILSMVSLGICFIPIIVMILSCCLYVKLKEPDD